jgi:eukaryotic-like serine/threonine-protein kinase
MAVRIEPNAEPIPGYRLLERLGGGGFGEVWKAEAPGGLLKAIKFVFGDLEASDDGDGVRATQELKALSRVKSVHHPYILSLERFDIIDGQLIIVMELADRTLWDRFRECRNQGLPGIPRDELLQYMRETAEALDLMNIQFQLQHLDIKPQNLFLVFNHIKVADFGLVKDLSNKIAATITGGVTPVYAAPETFDGWLSRYSDQYSLSIVYQELLTGQRPFTGSTMRQLVLQHLQGEPDLSSLPITDRVTVRKALAKNPDDRFPSCVEFIQALRAAGAAKPTTPSGLPVLPPSAPAPAPAAPAPPAVGKEKESPWVRAAEDIVVTHDARARLAPAEALDAERALIPAPSFDQVPPRPTIVVNEPIVTNEEVRAGTETQLQRPKTPGSHAGLSGDSGYRGIVQPSLVVGLGKLGVQTLLALRRTLSHEFGHPDALPHIRLVGLDTDAETIATAGKGPTNAVLRPHEVVLTRLHRPSHYLQLRDRDGNLPTDSWLKAKLIYRLPRQQTTAGLRAFGRLAFVDNFRVIAKRLEGELEACAAQDTLHELVQQADLGIRSPIPRVYVVAGLGGSTGSGMFIDAAYTLRHLLRKLGYSRTEVIGLFFLPSVEHKGAPTADLAQAYAALTELHHYATGQTAFSAVYDISAAANSTKPISEAGPPFERCYFLSMPRPASSARVTLHDLPETIALAGQFLYRDIATRIGKTIDGAREQWRRVSLQLSQTLLPSYQTMGLYRVVWPRKALLDQAARRLCQRLVNRWMAKDAYALSDTLATWAQEQWDESGLRPENLIARHQELCEQHLQQSPEKMLQDLLAPLAKLLAPTPGKPEASSAAPYLMPIVGAMGGIEKLLGLPEESRSGNLAAPVPGAIEVALGEVATALADAGDHQLTDLVVRLLEEPAFRLAGAEEGLRQFCSIAEHALRSQETLTKELHERAASLYQRIHALLETPLQGPITPNNSVWKLGFARKTPTSPSTFGADLLELVRIYSKTRYQCLILTHINRLYVGLRGHLTDQLREVGFCRQRLGELAGLVRDKTATTPPAMASYEKLLLPHGATSLPEALKRVDELVTDDDLLAFDRVLQPIIHQQYRALINVCMGPSNLVRTLAPLMLQEAETFLAPRFQGASVAEMWQLDKGDGTGAVAADLVAAFDEAAPTLGKMSAQKEISVVAFPTTPAGRQLKSLAQGAIPEAQLIDSDRNDEIIFYRELQQVSLQDLEQCNVVAQEAYRQRCATDPAFLHSRTDVAAWQSAAS